MRVDVREQFRGALGAALGIGITAWVSRLLLGGWDGVPWLLAPMGASAVLVFVLPSSPLGQPWPVVGGQWLSALAGLACARLLHDPAVAAAAAVGLAILAMLALRCLHPPGGGMALLAALGATPHPEAMLVAVGLNALLLVGVGIVYNPAFGHRYPHRAVSPAQALPPETLKSAGPRFTREDLEAALKHYREVLDVSRDDLEVILHEAEAAAYQRTLGSLRVRDVMSTDLVVAAANQPLSLAWNLMQLHRIKALPVVGTEKALVGILTRSDCLRALGLGTSTHSGALTGTAATTETVGRWMTAPAATAGDQQLLIELLPVFSKAGHHHLPILNARGHLVGMLTESDMVRALAGAVAPRG